MAKKKVKAHRRPRKGDKVRSYDKKTKKKGKEVKRTSKRTYKRGSSNKNVKTAETTAEKTQHPYAQAGLYAKKEADSRVDEA